MTKKNAPLLDQLSAPKPTPHPDFGDAAPLAQDARTSPKAARKNGKAAVPAVAQQAAPLAPAGDAMSYMAMISKAAENPNIDAGKMQALMDVHERVLNKQNLIAFNQALSRVQAKMVPIIRKGTVKYDVDKNDKSKGQTEAFKFARYEDIDAAIRPIYQGEGFSIRFNTKWGEQGATIFGTLAHIDGHSETIEMRLPLDASGGKNNLQGMGSTLSYGKRYIITMFFNIVTVGEDKDGVTPAEYLDAEKAAEIDSRLRKMPGGDEYRPKFLAYMKAANVQEILEGDYLKATNALDARDKAMKAAEAKGTPNATK